MLTFTNYEIMMMMKPVRSRTWTMVVVEPSFQDERTIERRMNRIPYAIYGRDWMDGNIFVFECLLVFNKPVPYEQAKRFFRKGNWTMPTDVGDAVDEIKAYEDWKELGVNTLDQIKLNLFRGFIGEGIVQDECLTE